MKKTNKLEKITKEQIDKVIDETAGQFVLHLQKNIEGDPAIFHFNRLLSMGLDRDDALRKISCVSAMFRLGQMSDMEIPNSLVSIMYEKLPDSDAEIYLYKLCAESAT